MNHTHLTRLPDPPSVEHLPAICLAILSHTAEAEDRELWRKERNSALAVLRRTKREGYFATEDACWDVDWAWDVLTDLVDGLEVDDRRQCSQEEAAALFADAAE